MNELGNSVSASLDAADVDRELASLRQRIDQSLIALDELGSIQSQFANLANTYRQYEEAIASLDSENSGELAEITRVYEERLAAVERELGSVELHVGDDISQQITALRNEIEHRLGVLEQQADERAHAVEDFKRTLHSRLEDWFTKQSSFDATEEVEEKLQRLAGEFVQTRTSHRRLKRQVRLLKVGGVIGGIALTLLVVSHLLPLIPQGTVEPEFEENVEVSPDDVGGLPNEALPEEAAGSLP